jgi:hypothetical protein
MSLANSSPINWNPGQPLKLALPNTGGAMKLTYEMVEASPESPAESVVQQAQEASIAVSHGDTERVETKKKRSAATKSEGPLTVFISYARGDGPLRERLAQHAARLRHEGLIRLWYDREVSPGVAWAAEIDEHLEAADIILLLISADFLASTYCWDKEMTRALERHDAGEARVVPVLLKPCDWRNKRLAALSALPSNGQPLTTMANRDAGFTDIVAGLWVVAHEILRSRN